VKGKTFDNPSGRGTTEIICVDSDKIKYRKRNTDITIRVDILYDAYKEYYGQKCSSNDLKVYRASVFNSKARPAGHNCNCTLLFLLLREIGSVNKIEGAGKAGSPFYVNIK